MCLGCMTGLEEAVQHLGTEKNYSIFEKKPISDDNVRNETKTKVFMLQG